MAEFFVDPSDLVILKHQKSEIENIDQRVIYPFERSTTQQVFKDQPVDELLRQLRYLVFDLFPGYGENQKQLLNYMYDRIRGLYVKLQKASYSQLDEFFIILALFCTHLQKSWLEDSYDKIFEMYMATNNWLFIFQNVMDAEKTKSRYQKSAEILKLEAQNDSVRLKKLALFYFESNNPIFGFLCLNSFATVSFSTATGDNKFIEKYGELKSSKTNESVLIEYTGDRFILDDKDFDFLLSKPYICQIVQHFIPEETKFRPYTKKAQWGWSRFIPDCYLQLEKVQEVQPFERTIKEDLLTSDLITDTTDQEENALSETVIKVAATAQDSLAATQQLPPTPVVEEQKLPQQEFSFEPVSTQNLNMPQFSFSSEKQETEDFSEIFSEKTSKKPAIEINIPADQEGPTPAANGVFSFELQPTEPEQEEEANQVQESQELQKENVLPVQQPEINNESNSEEIETSAQNLQVIRSIVRALNQEYLLRVLREKAAALSQKEELDELLEQMNSEIMYTSISKDSKINRNGEEDALQASKSPVSENSKLHREIINRFWPIQ